MVAFTSAWEDKIILPLLYSGEKKKIIKACKELVDDDTGDTDEVKYLLAGILIKQLRDKMVLY